MKQRPGKINDQRLLYAFIGILIGGMIGWYIAISAVNSTNSGMMHMMGVRSANQNYMQNSNSLDAHFIEQMIPHHEDAITMAELALQKAKKPEVKELAQNIITSQKKEIDLMKQWYKDWYEMEVPQNNEVMDRHHMGNGMGMHMGMTGDETDIQRLEDAQNFDKAFLEAMIPHHQMAVMMATMLKNGTSRQEMRKLADDIIDVQTKEINQMRSWLNDWFK